MNRVREPALRVDKHEVAHGTHTGGVPATPTDARTRLPVHPTQMAFQVLEVAGGDLAVACSKTRAMRAPVSSGSRRSESVV